MPTNADPAARDEALFRLITRADWRAAHARGGDLPERAVDRTDGFLHLSTGAQVLETAAKHFAGCDDLLAAMLDPSALTGDLRFEPSRGGALFPHLYGGAPVASVTALYVLIPQPDGFAFGAPLTPADAAA
ncbi:MAG: DUF952 domain-containing protein [Pseudomonadota bacterium]